MKLYPVETIDDLTCRYTNAGGEIYEMREGVLGHGDLLLYHPTGELKTIIIREKYINEWSSGHTVRAYNKMPAKYRKILESAGVA